jgi:hypothetical protein
MTADSFYWYASILIFIPWSLLLFAPNWKQTDRLVFGLAVLLLVAAAIFTGMFFLDEQSKGNLGTLEGLKNLFRNKDMLLTGWLNYLSFCLLVGLWLVRDASEQGVGRLWVVFSCLLVMVAGPTGLLFYLLVRYVKLGKWDVRS